MIVQEQTKEVREEVAKIFENLAAQLRADGFETFASGTRVAVQDHGGLLFGWVKEHRPTGIVVVVEDDFGKVELLVKPEHVSRV